MFTLKRRLLPRQHGQVPLELNKTIPIRREWHQQRLWCKIAKFDKIN